MRSDGIKENIKKVWDCVYPMVFFELCMLAVTLVVLIIGTVMTGSSESAAVLETWPGAACWINVGFYGVTLLMQRKTWKLDRLRFGPKYPWKSVGKCLGAALAIIVSGQVIKQLIEVSPLVDRFPSYMENAEKSFGGQNPLLLILALVVLAPLAEELIFRGLTYERIRHYLNRPAAIILSGLMFGAYHANMVQFVYASVLGWILAFVYDRSENLWICIGAHAVLNLLTVLVYIF